MISIKYILNSVYLKICHCCCCLSVEKFYTDDSGVIVGFSFEYSSVLIFDPGSMSIRFALCQTTTSIINAKNIIPDVVPATLKFIELYNNKKKKIVHHLHCYSKEIKMFEFNVHFT